MPCYVALLRGINVGGRNKVAMADLRRVVAALGYDNVSTYIQSGNVVFTGPPADPPTLATAIEKAVADELNVRPRVVVVPHAELAKVVADNPYADEQNPKYVHVVFRDRDRSPELLEAVKSAQEQAAAKGSRDEVTIARRVLYLHTPDGFGRSELAAGLTRIGASRRTGAADTARNWATVTKLLSLCDAAAT